MTTGQRMKVRRKEIGLSAEYVADQLGVSPATIYRYENGGIDKVPGDRLAPIAKVLQTTPAYLMGWDYDEKDISQELLDTMEDISRYRGEMIRLTGEKVPTPVSKSGLSAEQLELIDLFESASPALRSAALAVLRSAEGQSKTPDGSSTNE